MRCKLAGLTSFAFIFALPVSSSWAADRVGVVGNVEGSATAIAEDRTQRALQVGSNIFENDTISTDDNSTAVILFIDKSALTLTPGSQVKIDKYIYDPDMASGGMSLQEMKGAFRFIGGALSKQSHVEIKTPVSTVGIRGGIEETHIAPEGDSADAIFIYGQDMTVQDQNGKKLALTNAGDGAQVKKGAGPVRLSAQAVAHSLQEFHRARSAPARRRLMALRQGVRKHLQRKNARAGDRQPLKRADLAHKREELRKNHKTQKELNKERSDTNKQ